MNPGGQFEVTQARAEGPTSGVAAEGVADREAYFPGVDRSRGAFWL
jgi:hypothetical protein